MLIQVYCAKCIGIEAVTVTVEVDIRSGIGIHLVGLGDTAVKESLLRTVNALQSLGYSIPGKKIVINLAPADLRKNGSGYDLPIALGIIAASEQRKLPRLGEYLIMGELGLDGEVREITGALAYAEMAVRDGFRGCILPVRSAMEAVEIRQTEVYGIRTLEEAIRILSGEGTEEDLLVWNTPEYARLKEAPQLPDAVSSYMDFSEIIGQEQAKRGVEIAASGCHNVLLIGSPGSGKSSLAKAMAGILPPMSMEESVQTSKIYSVAGRAHSGVGLIRQRPFRAPHYTASLPALIGGGSDTILPGEMSLAHNGVLFIDEFCEAPKKMIEALRAPMEDRRVVISRLKSKVEYPASFMLVAATNPCPCGWYGEGDRCTCTPGRREAYIGRLSGPLLDRVDLQLWLKSVDPGKLVRGSVSETSDQVRARVTAAREIQAERFRDETIRVNAEMDNRMLRHYCPLDARCQDYLEKVMTRMGLSARACSRIIKLSRTIADLQAAAESRPAGPITVPHLAEAAGYRLKGCDRFYFPEYNSIIWNNCIYLQSEFGDEDFYPAGIGRLLQGVPRGEGSLAELESDRKEK